jgi:hypothetical protein
MKIEQRCAIATEPRTGARAVFQNSQNVHFGHVSINIHFLGKPGPVLELVIVACGLRYGCFGFSTKLVHCPRSKNTRAVFTSLAVLSKMTTTTNRHFSNQTQK